MQDFETKEELGCSVFSQDFFINESNMIPFLDLKK
jgi:hypothetical protein